MYNAHRGMVPAPNSRLTELLDQLRQEFETQSRSTGEFEHQRMSIPYLLAHAVSTIRRGVYGVRNKKLHLVAISVAIRVPIPTS